MNKETKKLHGKTIKNIKQSCINYWTINFTDKTSINLWSENNGPCGIAQLWLGQEPAVIHRIESPISKKK